MLALGIIAVLAVVYSLFDPAETLWMPKCPVHVLLGLDCPGCGSQRAIHALLHGDLKAATDANALILFFLPVVAVMAVGELYRNRWPRFYKALMHPAVIFGLLGIVLTWTIVRNIIY